MCALIGIDLDDSLYSFRDAALEELGAMAIDNPKLEKALYATWDQWRTPHDLCGHDEWMEVIRRVHDDDMILKQIPFQGAAETCRALIEHGHYLIYISNRSVESKDATYLWLTNHGFLSEYTELVCTSDDKQSYLRDCQFLIDDRPKTCNEFVYDCQWQRNKWAKGERKAFMKSYPYNQNLTDVPNLYLAPTWHGLNKYLVSKGVLSCPTLIK
jgi:hypothetical protein